MLRQPVRSYLRHVNFLISFLRGLLINHDTPPTLQSIRSNPNSPPNVPRVLIHGEAQSVQSILHPLDICPHHCRRLHPNRGSRSGRIHQIPTATRHPSALQAWKWTRRQCSCEIQRSWPRKNAERCRLESDPHGKATDGPADAMAVKSRAQAKDHCGRVGPGDESSPVSSAAATAAAKTTR